MILRVLVLINAILTFSCLSIINRKNRDKSPASIHPLPLLPLFLYLLIERESTECRRRRIGPVGTKVAAASMGFYRDLRCMWKSAGGLSRRSEKLRFKALRDKGGSRVVAELRLTRNKGSRENGSGSPGQRRSFSLSLSLKRLRNSGRNSRRDGSVRRAPFPKTPAEGAL